MTLQQRSTCCPSHFHVQRGWAEGSAWRMSQNEKAVSVILTLSSPCHASEGDHSSSASAGFRHHTSHTMPVAPVGWGGGLRFSQAARKPVGRAGIRGPGERATQLLSVETPPGGLPLSRMVFQPAPGSRSVAPGMLRPCSHPLQLYRSAPHSPTQDPRGWREAMQVERTESAQRAERGASAGEAVHPQEGAVSRVYFWQEGNHCKPLDRTTLAPGNVHIPHVVFPK